MHDLILLFHKMVRWTPTIIALWVCTGVSLISICTIVCFIAIRWVQPLFILIPVAAFTAFAVTASVLTARNSNFHPSAKGSWEQVNAFFINLDSSHDRNANLRKTFAMNRSLTRIPAVTVSQLPSYHISSPMCPLTRPVEFACLLSHLKAIVTAYMSGSQTALILEDDMIVLRWPKWAALTATAPPGWQVLQLFALGASANAIYSDKSAPLWSPRLPETWSAGAYLINRSGMEAVINAVMPGQIATLTGWSDVKTLILDNVLSQPWTPEASCNADAVIYDFTKTYVCSAIFFNELPSQSTIQDDSHAQFHLATTSLIDQIVQQQGFTFKELAQDPSS